MEANLLLSPQELSLVSDQSWIRTKRAILQKAEDMLLQLPTQIVSALAPNEDIFQQHFPIQPKISRGENYLGMPWRMLDFPRQFGKTDTFALRTFFWWGNFFSITLQLSGRYAAYYRQRIAEYLPHLQPGWYLGVHTDPWHHHFEKDNYRSVAEIIRESHPLNEAPGHIKLSYPIPVERWNEAQALLLREIETIGKMLHQLPNL